MKFDDFLKEEGIYDECAEKALEIINIIVECQEKYLREYEKKLDKIEQICKEAPNIDSEFSMRILEVIESEDNQ